MPPSSPVSTIFRKVPASDASTDKHGCRIKMKDWNQALEALWIYIRAPGPVGGHTECPACFTNTKQPPTWVLSPGATIQAVHVILGAGEQLIPPYLWHICRLA